MQRLKRVHQPWPALACFGLLWPPPSLSTDESTVLEEPSPRLRPAPAASLWLLAGYPAAWQQDDWSGWRVWVWRQIRAKCGWICNIIHHLEETCLFVSNRPDVFRMRRDKEGTVLCHEASLNAVGGSCFWHSESLQTFQKPPELSRRDRCSHSGTRPSISFGGSRALLLFTASYCVRNKWLKSVKFVFWSKVDDQAQMRVDVLGCACKGRPGMPRPFLSKRL